MSSSSENDITFHGNDWQVLNRVVALARFKFAQDSDYDVGTDLDYTKQNTYLASRFEGPALDWAAHTYGANRDLFRGPFDQFVVTVRETFGIHEGNITALLRTELDVLQWNTNVPVFFAEFDRLSATLGITSHSERIILLQGKLPANIKQRFMEQALSFASYDTMRDRCFAMWALDPTRGKSIAKAKSRCGSCGKKGHAASECRSKQGKN
jgi:hypothetical protein